MFRGANGGYYGVAIAQQLNTPRPTKRLFSGKFVFRLPSHSSIANINSPIHPFHIPHQTSSPVSESCVSSLKIPPTRNLTSHQSAPKRRCSLMTWRPISHLPHTTSEFTLSDHITLHSLQFPPIPTSRTSSHTPSHSLEATSAFFIVRPRPYPPQIFPPLPV